MKLSKLLKSLYLLEKERGTYKNTTDVAENTQLNKAFIERAFSGENTMIRIDALFEELTKHISDNAIESVLLGKKNISLLSKIEEGSTESLIPKVNEMIDEINNLKKNS